MLSQTAFLSRPMDTLPVMCDPFGKSGSQDDGSWIIGHVLVQSKRQVVI